MAKNAIHVLPSQGEWSVRKEGASRASKNFIKKEDAKEYGVTLGRLSRAKLYIHKKDGTIEERRSYGNDPFPPKDND